MNGNNRIKTQFSLRAVVALTVASAVWVWLFREAKPVEIAIFSGVALTAGLVGHVVYRYCVPWRVTVVATVLLLYNAVLLALEVLHDGSNPLELLLQVAVGPAEMLMHVNWHWHRDTVFMLAMVLGTLLFTPAHSIRPSLPTAIITALGLGFWYTTSILMMIYAG
jgi:hypothetical protein